MKNNILRRYKISKVLNNSLSDFDKELIDLIKSWLKDLVIFKMEDKYPNSIFYMNSKGDYVLEIMNNNLWVRYNGFWTVLQNKFKLEYEDIQSIIKYVVEETFKQKVNTCPSWVKNQCEVVEEAFKQKIESTTNIGGKVNFLAEKEFKLNSPYYVHSESKAEVEDAFKQKIESPTRCNVLHSNEVEEHFKQKIENVATMTIGAYTSVENEFKKIKRVHTTGLTHHPVEDSFKTVHMANDLHNIPVEEEFKNKNGL